MRFSDLGHLTMSSHKLKNRAIWVYHPYFATYKHAYVILQHGNLFWSQMVLFKVDP